MGLVWHGSARTCRAASRSLNASRWSSASLSATPSIPVATQPACTPSRFAWPKTLRTISEPLPVHSIPSFSRRLRRACHVAGLARALR